MDGPPWFVTTTKAEILAEILFLPPDATCLAWWIPRPPPRLAGLSLLQTHKPVRYNVLRVSLGEHSLTNATRRTHGRGRDSYAEFFAYGRLRYSYTCFITHSRFPHGLGRESYAGFITNGRLRDSYTCFIAHRGEHDPHNPDACAACSRHAHASSTVQSAEAAAQSCRSSVHCSRIHFALVSTRQAACRANTCTLFFDSNKTNTCQLAIFQLRTMLKLGTTSLSRLESTQSSSNRTAWTLIA